jgi:putative transposase
VLDVLTIELSCNYSPRKVYATLLDEGVYLCWIATSIATMYRILAGEDAVRERRDRLRHPVYSKPELPA